MKIKNKIVVFYLSIIIIPFIVILSLSNLYMDSVKARFDKEVSHVIDQNNINKLDKIEFLSSIIGDYTFDGILDELEEETLGLLFNRSMKIPLIINIDEKEVFRTPWVRDNIENYGDYKSIKYTNSNEHNIEYLYIEEIKIKRPIAVDIFKYYSKLSLTVVVVLFTILSFIFVQLLSKFFYNPLKKIEGKVNSIKTGIESAPLETFRKDEIGDVFLALNEMEREIKESRAFQERYEEKRSELLANISHDLKTPITAIRGYVDGINDGVANTPEKLKKYIGIISYYIKDMDALVDDLTLLSNLDIDINSMNFENVAFKDYIQDCVDELSFEMSEHGIDFNYSINISENVKVSMDRDKIKRVINNIITNAIKFTKKDYRSIKINVIDDSDYIKVTLSDNGIGIENDKIENIFDRFYRVDESRSSDTGGSGLGLSIAKQIIEKHRGTIGAKSEYGVYTDIYFRLKKV